MKVFTNHDWAGELDGAGARVRFAYQPACKPEQAVALLMPVRQDPYVTSDYDTLHPVFDMNIPEGYLYEELARMFSKVLRVVDRFTMLEMTGRSQIGRLRIAASVDEIKNVPARSLKEMLVSRGTAELFADLLKRYAHYSGIAGVQPKVLARDDGALGSMMHTGLFSPATGSGKAPARVTSPGTTHIVKMSVRNKFPAIATNEFLCLKAAKQAGLPAPAVWLGDNRQCLIVERFDIKPDGTYLGFEDVCALKLMQSRLRYLGTCEDMARTLSRHSSNASQDMRILFEAVVLTCCLRNGDAHLKNFGVLYDTPGEVRLSPMYDMVSTVVYQQGDTLALSVGGSQQWPTSKRLLRYGVAECGLTRREAQDGIAKVVEAVDTVRREIPSHINDSATEAEQKALGRMDAAWQAGIASLSHRGANLDAARIPVAKDGSGRRPKPHSR